MSQPEESSGAGRSGDLRSVSGLRPWTGSVCRWGCLVRARVVAAVVAVGVCLQLCMVVGLVSSPASAVVQARSGRPALGVTPELPIAGERVHFTTRLSGRAVRPVYVQSRTV